MFDFFEFFAGGGMVRAGLGAKWRCRFANDFDQKKSVVYRRNFGDGILKTADVRTLTTEDLPGAVDLAWASFPCQADERLIFIDLNAAPALESTGKPPWIEQAAARLEKYEKHDLAKGRASLCFRNKFSIPLQAKRDSFDGGISVRPRYGRLQQAGGAARLGSLPPKAKKHIDAYYIGDALSNYLKCPGTFDGSLPSETINGSSA
jgi:hypothetical protein